MTWILAWATGRMKFLFIDVGQLPGRIRFMGKIDKCSSQCLLNAQVQC